MNGFKVFVAGAPQTKGSAKAYARLRKDGSPFANITNDNKKAAGWEALIRDQIRLEGCCAGKDLGAACRVHVEFRFQRPKSQYRSGRHERELHPHKAQPFHLQKPDSDKAVRVVLDALTGVAYLDDKQVVDHRARKVWVDRWTEPEGALIEVEYLIEGSA